MSAIVGLIAFFIVAMWLIKGLPNPPKLDGEQELINNGYTVKEAKEELRKQRQEYRQQSRAVGYGLRTANKIGRFAKSITKDIK